MDEKALLTDIPPEQRPKLAEGQKRWLRRRDMLSSPLWAALGSFVGMSLALLVFGGLSGLRPQSLAPPLIEQWLIPQMTSTTHANYTGKTIPGTEGGDVSTTENVWKCIPPPPPFLLEDSRITSHPVVLLALANSKRILEANAKLYKDAVSVSIVHASKGKIFDFHSGRIKLNDSWTTSPATVDGDSIFRIASISKVFTVLEALILGRQAQLNKFTPELTLDSRLQEVLPEFKLPARFEDEAAEITLAQLGSHRAGIGRDVGELEINSLLDIIYPPNSKIDGLLDSFPHNRTKEEVLSLIAEQDLIWQVGETPSYSNTGFSLLGMAVTKYHDRLWKQGKNFTAIMNDDIFTPLDMDHTFTGPIPPLLKKQVTVPGSRSFVDKLFSLSVDPAGGIYSTSNDLSKFLHRVLLASKPRLITPAQRLSWLKSVHQFTGGLTSVGVPWETFRAIMPDYSVYNIYTKGGGLPGQFSEISTFPEFGYGIVVLTSIATTDEELFAGGNFTDPLGLSFQIHNTLAPAIWAAYNTLLIADYVGIYADASGGSARVTFKEGMLVLEALHVKGVDVLLKWDELTWTQVGKRPRRYENGAKLVGTAFAGQFRTAELHGCGWYGFDA
ncbi:hypothetical protein ABW20_dc0109307 [Dactylellina cionopaga]|nr:hypothetical protein ABW20_dc0109307 [Dactylellina cionopaga]